MPTYIPASLRDSLAAAAAARQSELEQLRAAAAARRAAWRAEHRERAAAERRLRAAGRTAARLQAADLLGAYDHQRQALRADQQLQLSLCHETLRHAVAGQLADLAAGRARAAADQRAFLTGTAAALRDDTAALLESLRAARAATAAATHAELDRQLGALREGTASFLAAVAQARALMGADQRLRLGRWAAGLHAEVLAFLGAVAEARALLGADQRDRLAAAAAALRSGANTLLAPAPSQAPAPAPAPPRAAPCGDPAAVQRLTQAGISAYAQLVRVTIARELEASRGALGPDQRRTLGSYVENLAGSVRDMLRDLDTGRAMMDDEQLSLAAEQIDGLRRSLTALMREISAADDRSLADLSQAVTRIVEDVDLAYLGVSDGRRPAGRRPHPAPSNDIRDDLTVIRGIGPGTQQRLNQAGIATFIQIALSTPEELRRALGGSASRLANVDEWIASARRLAGIE